MNVFLFIWLSLASIAVFIPKGVCFWNWWESRPVDGQWSSWSSWSTCQITSEPDTLPFRYKERNCSNPSPKNEGAECKGASRRTSSCDDCNIPLGLESGRIQDSFMTALHYHREFPASAARLNGKSAWCSRNPENLEQPLYLQVELKKLTAISAIASQGFYPAEELMSLRMGRVSKYQLMYSTNGVAWKLYQDSKNETILRGNTKRNGTVLNILTPEITARFIRVYPLSYWSFICMRLELYGCSFGCGGELSKEPGSIIVESSPMEDRDCLWHVQLPNVTKLNFDFINFNVPCSDGYTELRDGNMPYSSATVLAQYCGYDQPPPLITSNNGELWVRFKSNSSDSQTGFYSIYFPGCGGHLLGSNGEIKSPNFPKEYFHNSKCIWTINVPEGKSVRLKFVEFNVEGDLNRHRCPHDHLTIWNGSDSNAPLVGKYCNSNPPPSFICSSGNSVRLKFRSDDALAWSGFLITYSEVDPLMACVDMSSSIVMPTASMPWTISMSLTPTPFITTESIITQQTVFSTNILGLTTKTDRNTLTPEASSVESSAMIGNGTVGFTGTSADGNLEAAARGKQQDDDDDDKDSLTTVIILSAFAFVVICMIFASIIPSIKHHYEKRKCEKEMNLMVAASLSIPETNSKDTFEVVPIATDELPILDSIACEAVSNDQNLPPVEAAETESLSETPTVEFGNEQSEDVMETGVPVTRSDLKANEVDDLENGQTDTDGKKSLDLDNDAPEIGSLRMSYEDLGSSFAGEMQAMLSQLVDDDELPGWNLSIFSNAENSSQGDETEAERSSVSELETENGIPQSDLPTQDDTKSIPSSEASANNTCSDQRGKLEKASNSDDIEMREIREIQPDHVNGHSHRNTAGNNRVSGSCTDSKDSGCASSSENLQSVCNNLLYAESSHSETCV